MIIARRFILVVFGILSMHSFLSAQLTRQWVARFNGGIKNSNNVATAMAVDGSGNIIVTGWVTRKTTGIDFATVKYSPDGEKLHEAFYDSMKGVDKAYAIAVDSGKNVYVTGSSFGGASGLDYVTIKYDSNLTTPPLWVRRYNGAGNGEDQPSAIAVNDSLNVYVTGWSMGSGTNFDYATLKYDSAGNFMWERRYNGPANGVDSALAMALRGTSDLYVTGASVDTGYDFLTIKYGAAAGDTQWIRRYNGPGNGSDIARAIVLRSSTDVFVTGGSQDSANGLPADYDYATIRYDAPTGDTLWVSRYNGTANGDDQAYAIAIQSNTRVYVTGRSLQVGSFNDIVTVRYNFGTGNENWVSAYNGTANDNDGGVALSGGGSPYVLGPSAGAGVGVDYALIQYNGSNGNENFNVRYNGPGNSDDIPHAVISSGGGVYVTGSSKASDKGSDFLTIKYVDPDKMKYRTLIQDSLIGKGVNLKSLTTVPNSANVRDEAFAKAYPKIKKGFAGYPGGLVLGNARPDSALSYGWIRFDKGKAIANFVPHTGASRGFDTTLDGKQFVGEKKNPKLDKYNNHLVGELLALRVNIGASDAEITPPTFGDLTYNLDDTVNGIPLKGMSLRTIASLADNFLTYWKKYQPVNWALLDSIFSRVNRSFTGPLRVVSKQPFVVTGAVHIDSVSFLQPATVPLQEPLAFEPGSILEDKPSEYALFQNYPNPFNPTTTIEFELPEAAPVSLIVYDMLGRQVAAILDNDMLDEGAQEITFNANGLASGVYFYRLLVNNGQFSDIRKMVLLK
ncbi:MAG: T9SS type A sorting domain-containing protein [Ignavibacteriae bacterium]|nr:T9SS type A sorting domain-containing protein [Ignavibacteria bacterium]MBI3365904.1 T9SS type A sorting domain-containing protein [Ignavibacteriota bacterium]